MTFDWWTFLLQTVNALVLVWLLARFLFRPVSRIITERQATAHAALDQAEAARKEAEAALAQAQKERDAVAAARADMIAAAQEEAAKQERAMLAEARKSAEKARAETEAELSRLRETEAQHWQAEAAALAVDMTERLLGRLPGGARTRDFVEGLAVAVAKLPQMTRDRIGRDGPAVLHAAGPLGGDEQALVSERLAAVLGRPVALRFETDATLIAGLELDTPHAIVRNSIRADLERIAQEVARDG